MADMACEICGEKVTQWSVRYEADVMHCKKCYKTSAAKEFIDKKYSTPSTSNTSISSKFTVEKNDIEYSFLSLLFFFLAGLSLLGGLILCGQLWPGDPGYRNEWKTIAYIPAITWFTVGLVQFALFAAFGQGLHYLRQIVSNTEEPNKSIQPTANASAD